MRTHKTVWASISLVAIGLAASASAAIPGTLATFDVDEEGFQGSTTGTTQIHLLAGGNPDGFVQIRKEVAVGFDIGTQNSVTPGFLGDYAAAGIDHAGFDLNVFNTTLDEAHLRFRRNVAENGWYFDFGQVLPAGNAWDTYDVNFDPTWNDVAAAANGWTQEAGAPSFAALLADVGWIEVRAINEGSSIVGVDNVRITPEPTALILMLAGVGVLVRRR